MGAFQPFDYGFDLYAARALGRTAGKRPGSPAAAASWSCAPTPAQDVTVHLYEDAVLRFCAAEGLLTLEMGPVCGAGRDVRRMKLDKLEQLELYLDGSTLKPLSTAGTPL